VVISVDQLYESCLDYNGKIGFCIPVVLLVIPFVVEVALVVAAERFYSEIFRFSILHRRFLLGREAALLSDCAVSYSPFSCAGANCPIAARVSVQ
jgi:hypothetical protein